MTRLPDNETRWRIRQAAEAARSMLRDGRWRDRQPQLVEKYLTLLHARDPRPIAGALHFNSLDELLREETLTMGGQWTKRDVVMSAALADADRTVLFVVRNGPSRPGASGADRRRIDEARDALDAIGVELAGWIVVAGTLAITERPTRCEATGQPALPAGAQ